MILMKSQIKCSLILLSSCSSIIIFWNSSFIICIITLLKTVVFYSEGKIQYEASKHKYGPSEPDARIVGGYQANVSDHPYQVSLQLAYKKNRNMCGGCVVNEMSVLSAAHCVYGIPKEDLVIIAGIEYLWNRNATRFEVLKYFVHFEYNASKSNNDIAVIVIKDKFVFSSKIRPVPIAELPPAIPMACVVTGWGATDKYKHYYTTRLYALTIFTRETDKCFDDFPLNYDCDTQICAGGLVGKDTCNGDSGGPLVCNNILFGILSYGSHNCGVGYVTVFVNVSYFKNWIANNIMHSSLNSRSNYSIPFRPAWIQILIVGNLWLKTCHT